jgi:Flp pilus assembly protein protease CpaA
MLFLAIVWMTIYVVTGDVTALIISNIFIAASLVLSALSEDNKTT